MRESWLILAPDGRPCPWTRGIYPGRAIFKLLRGRIAIWPYAQTQGYRCVPAETIVTVQIEPPDFGFLYRRVPLCRSAD
jgi:hypothetical protein